MDKINILLMCGNLSYAGSQRQLVTLAKHLNKDKFNVFVCSLTNDIQLKPELDEYNIILKVITRRFKYDFSIIFRIARLLKAYDIHVVYSFLFMANIIARIAGRLVRTPVIISSERSSNYERKGREIFFERFTQRFSDLIIANSQAGKDLLIREKKIPETKIRVVYNGIDFKRFAAQINSNKIRTEFDIPQDALVIGMIARYKPAKNHKMFFMVAKEIISKYLNVYFLCIGDVHPKWNNYYKELTECLGKLGIKERIILAGKRFDIPDILNLMDISVLTSLWEGLPNTLIESMAAGIPVVVTDVSDNSLIVENGVNGFVVPINDVDMMVQKIRILLENEKLRKEIGNRNRKKAVSLFSVDKMVKNTEDIFLELLIRNQQAEL